MKLLIGIWEAILGPSRVVMEGDELRSNEVPRREEGVSRMKDELATVEK